MLHSGILKLTYCDWKKEQPLSYYTDSPFLQFSCEKLVVLEVCSCCFEKLGFSTFLWGWARWHMLVVHPLWFSDIIPFASAGSFSCHGELWKTVVLVQGNLTLWFSLRSWHDTWLALLLCMSWAVMKCFHHFGFVARSFHCLILASRYVHTGLLWY